MYNKKEHIHLVGVGGIGMSGIAKILNLLGYTVSGCDLNTNKNTLELENLGCKISNKHNQDTCKNNVGILVYSTATKSHPEVLSAQENGIVTVHRSEMLSEILRKNFNVSITGSHGKTTTTSLISHILIEAGIEPTVLSGGNLKKYGTQAILGKSNISVSEADESDRSLLNLPTAIGVLTNISLEHLETYKDIDDIKNTFKKFLNNISFYGKAVVCIDDENIQAILPEVKTKIIKYGLSEQADITAKNLKLYPECSRYELWLNNNKLADVELEVPGKHNILNSLAAIAVSMELDIPLEKIIKSIKSFDGVERRFEYHGQFKGAEVFDDYGHHPNEIANTLEVARNRTKGNLFVVFQPHRFTRTKSLWNQFVDVFANSKINSLVITDIFAASEAPIEGVNSRHLTQDIKDKNLNIHAKYLPIDEEFSSIIEHIDSEAKANDLILFLGAGKLNKVAELLTRDHKSLQPK